MGGNSLLGEGSGGKGEGSGGKGGREEGVRGEESGECLPPVQPLTDLSGGQLVLKALTIY